MKKSDCLFIGDSEHDYEAALNSKVDFLLKLNGFTCKPKSYFQCKKFLTFFHSQFISRHFHFQKMKKTK